MPEDFRLKAEPREALGSRNTQRLRQKGLVPANVYGFKKDAVNLSVALAALGHRVGLLDADIYGPNVPTMLGVEGAPDAAPMRIECFSPEFTAQATGPQIIEGRDGRTMAGDLEKA